MKNGNIKCDTEHENEKMGKWKMKPESMKHENENMEHDNMRT